MLGTSSAGPSGSHLCWVATDRAYNDSILPLWIAILLYLLPLFLIECYNIYVFRFLAKTLRQIPSADSLLNRLTRYLAIVIGTKFLFLLTRATRLAVPSNTIFAIGVFTITGAPMQGIGDYLIFRDGERSSTSATYSSTSSAYIKSTNGSDTGEEPMSSLSAGGGGGGGGIIKATQRNPLHSTTTSSSSASMSMPQHGQKHQHQQIKQQQQEQQDEEEKTPRRMSEVSLLGGSKTRDPYQPLQALDDADEEGL